MHPVTTPSPSRLLTILIGLLLLPFSSSFAVLKSPSAHPPVAVKSVKPTAVPQLQTGPDEVPDKKNEIDRLIESIVANQTAIKKKTSRADRVLGIERPSPEPTEDISEIPLMTPSSYFTNLIMKKEPLLNIHETFIWPALSHHVSSDFGIRIDPFDRKKRTFHKGLDISGNQGDKVFAVKSGVVCYAGIQRDYGNIVIIRHPDNYYSLYAHNSILLVRSGQKVSQGEVISRIGRTGKTTGPHLHFEIRKYAVQMDPMGFYPKIVASKR